jgi:ankyrin repeat protein
LVLAAQRGRTECVRQLLITCSAEIDVNAMNDDGMTALMWAAYQNYTPILQLFIDHHANVNAQGVVAAASAEVCDCETSFETNLVNGSSSSPSRQTKFEYSKALFLKPFGLNVRKLPFPLEHDAFFTHTLYSNMNRWLDLSH